MFKVFAIASVLIVAAGADPQNLYPNAYSYQSNQLRSIPYTVVSHQLSSVTGGQPNQQQQQVLHQQHQQQHQQQNNVANQVPQSISHQVPHHQVPHPIHHQAQQQQQQAHQQQPIQNQLPQLLTNINSHQQSNHLQQLQNSAYTGPSAAYQQLSYRATDAAGAAYNNAAQRFY